MECDGFGEVEDEVEGESGHPADDVERRDKDHGLDNVRLHLTRLGLSRRRAWSMSSHHTCLQRHTFVNGTVNTIYLFPY